MAITYPLSIPTNVSFSQARMIARSVVGVSRSPFTGEEQIQKHQGQWFEFDGKLPPMTRANAEEWIAFLLKLNGRQYTFLLGDPSAKTARGIATGTPLINGASQTGNSLITDGWTASQTGILKAGDYFQIGTGANARLYKVLQDADSDGSGNATFDIWPSINTAYADDAALIVSSTVGLFRLASNEMGWDISTAQNYGIAFGAVSVV
tara:strand:- start:50 stop:670 length:621 start_codon:yes stop_codon:yes gene_type:complete